MSAFGFIRKAIDRISGFLTYIATWGVVAMMLLVVVDVGMRALVGQSTLIADEMGGYLLVLIAYLGMAEAYRLGRHIRVDIVTARLPGRLRLWLDAVLCLVGLAALIIVIWRVVIMVHRSKVADVIIPGVFLTPVYLPQTLVIIGLVALALQCAVDAIDRISALRGTPEKPEIGGDKEAEQV